MSEDINDVLERYKYLTSQGNVAIKPEEYEHVFNYANKKKYGEWELMKLALNYGVAVGYKAALDHRVTLSRKNEG